MKPNASFIGRLLLAWGIGAVVVMGAGTGAGNSNYLYRDEEGSPVLEYTEDSGLFLKSTKPRIVEFYSPHCGACRSFKPNYIELAKSTQRKHSDVEFYGVSCLAHNDMCRKFQIGSYPSLYAFTAGDDQQGELVKRSALSQYTPERLAEALKLSESGNEEKATEVEEDDKQEDDEAETKAGSTDEKEKGKASEEEEEEEKPDKADAGDEDDNGDKEDSNPKEESTDNNGDQATAISDDPKAEGDDDADDAKDKDDTKEDDKSDDEEQKKTEVDDGKEQKKTDLDNHDDGDGDDNNKSKQNESQADGDDPGKVDADGDAEDHGTEDEIDGDKDEGKDEDQSKKSEDADGDVGPNGVASDDNQVEENGGDDASAEKESEEAIPTPQEPNFTGKKRVAGAGAVLAKRKANELNRWQEHMAEKKRKAAKHGTMRLGRPLLARNRRADDKAASPENLTPAMKSATPGTPEFEERKKMILAHLQRLHKAGKLKRMPKLFTSEGHGVSMRKENLPYKKDVRKIGIVRKQVEKIPIVKRVVAMSEEEELILDTTMSFMQSLKYGVFMSDDKLPAKKKEALEAWLDLLSVSLPTDWALHRLIDRLRRSINTISKSRAVLTGFLDAYPLPRNHWSKSCRGNGEFTCGLWKLLHVVTVGVAENRGGLNLIDADLVDEGTRVFSPIDAADTIRDFIDNFMTCEPCRKHFVSNYDDCDKNRRCDRLTDAADDASTADWKELAIWLWEVHNEVSVRVAKSRFTKESIQRIATAKSSKTYEIASLWPTINTCIRCFDENGQWNEAEIFEKLERSYWPAVESDPVSDRLITFDDESSLRLMWFVILIIVAFVYSIVGKNNRALHHSILRAKRMIATGGSKLHSV